MKSRKAVMDFWLVLGHIAIMWMVTGWIFVGLGMIGAFLPLMPTVPFLLVALFCFERGSPRLHAWLIHHPQMGPPIQDWQKYRVIRWRAKLIATIGLSGSCAYTFIGDKPLFVKWVVGAICSMALAFILTRKSSRI